MKANNKEKSGGGVHSLCIQASHVELCVRICVDLCDHISFKRTPAFDKYNFHRRGSVRQTIGPGRKSAYQAQSSLDNAAVGEQNGTKNEMQR